MGKDSPSFLKIAYFDEAACTRIIWILQMVEGLTGAKKKIRSVLQKF